MANTRAAIITIGDELLIGQTTDTNSGWMAGKLNEIGIDVVRRIAVGDNKTDIIKALNDELASVQIVLITGGLGPTANDITKPLLCEYFGGKLIVDEQVLANVSALFAKRNLPILERNMKQAEVPDVCKVLFNHHGTAPGMWFEKENKIIISMPGVPHEMMGIMNDWVLPDFTERYTSDALLHRSIITAGQGESFIAERIQDIEERLPAHIKLAYLPGAWMVKLRLTGRGANKELLTEELDALQQKFAARLNDITVSLLDEPLEYVVGKCLEAQHKTIALAESCTGGYIAHTITQVQGASHYFKGGIVCYQNEIKEKLLGIDHEVLEALGAVCEDVVKAMAMNARKIFNTTIGFGITGLLSEGGEDNKAPVGTVWMAVADDGGVQTKQFNFPYSRTRNKEVAVQMALLMIWKNLNKHNG